MPRTKELAETDSRKETRLTPFAEWVYFPRAALIHFAWSLAVVASLIVLADRLFVPYLESKSILIAEEWKEHHNNAILFMKERNLASPENPIWCSEAYPVDKARRKKHRIIVMGDSYVWGHGQANMNHLWWRQLEEELARRGYDVEVIGAGRSGANTSMELNWAKKLNAEYKPDLIIYSYVVNDAAEYEDETNKKLIVPHLYKGGALLGGDAKPTYTGITAFVHDYLPNLFYHLNLRRFQKGLAKISNPVTGYDWEDWEMAILQGRSFEKFKQTLKRVRQFNQDSGVPNLFVMMTMPQRERFEPRLRPIESLLRENNIPYLDLTNEMIEWYSKNFPKSPQRAEFALGVNPVDNHSGPIANWFYALKTAELLERDYKPQLGEKQEIPARDADASGALAARRLMEKNGSSVINDWVPFSISLQQQNPTTYSFEYPDPPKALLTMPLHRPYVQFNFANATDRIKQIEISGDDLSSCALALGLEDGSTHTYLHQKDLDLGEKSGKSVVFQIPESKNLVCELKVTAKFSGKNRHVNFMLVERQ